MALMTQAEFRALEADGWEKAGTVSVDTGKLWIGDPSYVFDRNPKDIPEKLIEFLQEHRRRVDNGRGAAQWKHDAGHDGLGVSVDTGVGDGHYTVLVRYEELDPAWGRCIAELRIVFLTE